MSPGPCGGNDWVGAQAQEVGSTSRASRESGASGSILRQPRITGRGVGDTLTPMSQGKGSHSGENSG